MATRRKGPKPPAVRRTFGAKGGVVTRRQLRDQGKFECPGDCNKLTIHTVKPSWLVVDV